MENRKENVMPGVGGKTERDAGVELERPRFAMEGHEDEVYHEARLPKRGNEPDYHAVLDKSWTFNRAMTWPETGNGTVLCFESGGTLALTGEERVSDWFSDPVNVIEHAGSCLVFNKNSSCRREVAVLPGFQINLEQHPSLRVSVTDASCDWQVCVLVKGRSGPPLVASDWRNGKGEVTLDIAGAWRAKGFAIDFAELHVVFGLWSGTEDSSESATLDMCMPGMPALVPCLPVVRTAGTASRDGVPLSVAVIGCEGNCVGPAEIEVTADFNGNSIPLTAHGDIRKGSIPGLTPGEHVVRLKCSGSLDLNSALKVRVTGDDDFLAYERNSRSLVHDGIPLGPLSGSYQGIVFARDVGKPSEKLVNGQKEWEQWDKDKPPGEHWHYWEALTEAELETRFGYLEECGWDLLHLCQGFGLWEKLDACGHIAPHGAEQLATLLRVAARHGLRLLQALSHYPYSAKFTPPLRQYIEAGYQDSDWTHPESASRFTELFHGYLADFAALFCEEPALFAMSTSGEGDIAAGPERINDTCEFMTARMPRHIFLAEPIHRLIALPELHRRGWFVHSWTKPFAEGCKTDVAWKPELAGSRMYWMGEELHPEIDLGIEFKFLQMDDCFMGEGSWPCHHLYAEFMGKVDTWAGTERYRRRVRDSLYIGLVHRCPMMLTWEEQYTEDERVVLKQVREMVDWSQPFMEAPVAIRVDSPNVGGGPWGSEGREVLARYEECFSALPLMTRYLREEESSGGSDLVLDARKPFEQPAVPPDLPAGSPLELSLEYRAGYLWASDRRTMIAYVYNSSHHECIKERTHLNLSGKWHRLPAPAECTITLKNMPDEDLMCRVFSLEQKRCLKEIKVRNNSILELGVSTDDYCVVVGHA